MVIIIPLLSPQIFIFFVTNGQSFGRFTANDQRHLDSLKVLLNEGTQLAWAVFSGTLKIFGAIHISNR